jgi:hypothetical protein
MRNEKALRSDSSIASKANERRNNSLKISFLPGREAAPKENNSITKSINFFSAPYFQLEGGSGKAEAS